MEEFVDQTFGFMIGPIENVVESAMEIVKQKIETLATTLEHYMTTTVANVKDGIRDMFMTLLTEIEDDVMTMINGLKASIEDFARQTKMILNKYANDIQTQARDAVRGVEAVFDRAESRIARLGSVPQVIVTDIGSAGRAIDNIVSTELSRIDNDVRSAFAVLRNNALALRSDLPSIGTVTAYLSTDFRRVEKFVDVNIERPGAILAESMLRWLAILGAVSVVVASVYFSHKITK